MQDFRGETLYFLFVDRFCEGDPEDSYGKDADHDPTRTHPWMWWGGDLRGLISKLDYLDRLGVSAVWTTPLFTQGAGVEGGGARMAPYHGYSPVDWKRLDPHLCDRHEDLDVLQRDDTVLDELVDGLHRRGMKLVLDVVTEGDEKDANWREDFASTISRWAEKGADGLRLHTAKQYPIAHWKEFLGRVRNAKPDLFAVGEWFQGGWNDPLSVEFANESGATIFDFAWRNAVVSALAHRSPRGFEEVQEVVLSDVLFKDPNHLVTFVENHDLPRFLSLSNDPDRYRLAVLLTMVSRGVPCLFYGGEQLLHDDRSRGHDPYNRPMMRRFDATPLGRDIARLAKLRGESPSIQRGGTRPKHLAPDRYAFTRVWAGSCVLVVCNRSDESVDIGLVDVELPDGAFEDVLGACPAIDVTEGGLRVHMPPRSIAVYSHVEAPKVGRVAVDIFAEGIRTHWGEDLLLTGDAPELGEWDLARAVKLDWVNHGTWGATVAFDESAGREVRFRFVLRRRDKVVWETGEMHARGVPAEPAEGGSRSGRVDAIWHEPWRG